MKKLLAIILALVAVFCTFAGCGQNSGNDVKDGGTNITDNTDGTENGENTGDDNNGGENNGSGNENTGNEDDKPTYTIVQPITDGGSFTGGDYDK